MHSSIDEHLDYFSILVIVNHAVMICPSLWDVKYQVLNYGLRMVTTCHCRLMDYSKQILSTSPTLGDFFLS